MAEFSEINDLKAEIRDQAPTEVKDRRKNLILTSNNLDDMVDETIGLFKMLHPIEWVEFEERVKEKRANATKFGAPTKATAEEKNMELRSEMWMPSVAIEVEGLRGKRFTKYRDLKGVVAAIYKKHGFEDFPNVQNHAEFLMLKDFKRRWPCFFIAEEL